MKKNNGTVIGLLVLLWFIGSIMSMMSQLVVNPYISAMIFGQLFVGFGLIAMISELLKKSKKDKASILFCLPFLLIGLLIVIISFLMMNPNLLDREINWNSVIAIIMLIIFAIAGICLIIIPIIIIRRLKRVCNVSVPASIIRYETYVEKNNTVYAPVYAFTFNSKNYEVHKEQYTNIKIAKIGTNVELKVNPRNPEEFMDNEKLSKAYIILGILFLIVSIPVLIYVLKTFTIFK